MEYSAQKDGHADDLRGRLYTEIGFLHRELNPGPVTHSSTNQAILLLCACISVMSFQLNLIYSL